MKTESEKKEKPSVKRLNSLIKSRETKLFNLREKVRELRYEIATADEKLIRIKEMTIDVRNRLDNESIDVLIKRLDQMNDKFDKAIQDTRARMVVYMSALETEFDKTDQYLTKVYNQKILALNQLVKSIEVLKKANGTKSSHR